VREAKEELNVVIEDNDLKYLFTIDSPRTVLNAGAYIDHEFQDVYLFKIGDDVPNFKLQTEEVAEIKWVPWRELQKVIQGGSAEFVPHQEEYEKLFAALAVL
jgi:8-oxo-dGTP pyrophosphatase MutT (NUDIX family)